MVRSVRFEVGEARQNCLAEVNCCHPWDPVADCTIPRSEYRRESSLWIRLVCEEGKWSQPDTHVSFVRVCPIKIVGIVAAKLKTQERDQGFRLAPRM